MAYLKHTWHSGEPITQERMNTLESGVLEASSLAFNADTLSKDLNTRVGQLGDISAKIINKSTIVEALNSLADKADNTGDTINLIEIDATKGQKAWALLLSVGVSEAENGTLITGLGSVLQYANGRAFDLARTDLSNLQTTIHNAATLQNENVLERPYAVLSDTSLSGRIKLIDKAISSNRASINTLAGDISDINNSAGSGYTLAGRMELIANVDSELKDARKSTAYKDGVESFHTFTSLDERLEKTEEEIVNAHSSTANNESYASIDARLETDETVIGNLKVGKLNADSTGIENSLNSTDINRALSANMGYTINQMFGSGIGTTQGTTVAEKITSARSAAEAAALTYADTNKVDKLDIKKVLTYETDDNSVLQARLGKLLKDAIDTINSDLNTANTGLKARMDAAESAVNLLNDNANTEGSVLHTVTSKIAEVVAEAPEAFDTLKEIADWIGENSDDALTMQQNISANASAISDLETALGDNNSGLIQRINTAESDIDALETIVGDNSSGLVKNVADNASAISSINTAISHAASGNDPGGLRQRIALLENEPKSATVIIPVDCITYNSQTGIPTIYTANDKIVEVIPTQEADYLLLGTDEKYYYWKYVGISPNGSWNLISSASEDNGGGNSSGIVLTAEQYADENLVKAENTDYFVKLTDGYHHYRWIPGETEGTLVLIEINDWAANKSEIKKYNMMTVPGEKLVEGLNEPVAVTYLNLYEYGYGEDNSIIDTQAEPFAQIELPRGGDGSASSGQKTSLLRIGSEVILKVVGSTILLRVFYSSFDANGLESSTGYATLTVGNTVIFSNRELSSCENPSEVPSGWKSETAGYHEFDVTNYCGVGNTNFTLSVNVNGTNIGKTWRVNLTDLRLETSAPDNLLISANESYDFPYTPIGAIQKQLYVTIDKGTENEITNSIPIADNISSVPSTYTIEGLTHGKHTIEMKLAAQIGGTTEYSNVINREYIWYDINDVDNPIIIASKYEGTIINASLYSTIEIPYQVYKKNADIIIVEYYLDNSETPYQINTLDSTNVDTLAYIADTVGSHTLKIKVDDTYILINVNITASDKNLSPVSGAVIDFDPTMLTNNAENRLPEWNTRINLVDKTFRFTTSDNFNWSEDINGGGYKKDSNGDKCFVIKAGSYIDLNYPMFANDVFSNGAEMKISFKTAAVRNANAIWYQNVGEVSGKTVGIQLSAHSGWLKTDKAVSQTVSADEDTDEDTITVKGITYTYWKPNTEYLVNDIRVIRKVIYRCINASGTSIEYDLQDSSYDLDEDPGKSYLKKWLKIGLLDTEILATNSYLYFPYSEEDKIELDININKNAANNNFIMSYEDGVPSKAYAYTTGAGGDQITHNGTIRIGSDECDVYIYRLRYYVKALSTDQILQNFISDGKDLEEKISRYDRNCIYWNSSLNNGEGGYVLTKTSESQLDPIKLAEKMPDVKVLMLDTDIFTTGKKDFVMNSSLRCIHADGGNVYTSRGDEDNWLFINGFHAGQGTTSDNYGQSARNVDFLFEVDAKHWPSKEKNMGSYKISLNPNYISAVIKGKEASVFNNSTWEATYPEWTEDTPYIIGDKVTVEDSNNAYKKIIYSCTRAHTSEETFTKSNWKQIGTISTCSDWMADDCKVSLTESSVPNNYFNLKVNVASSENVNNALFQKRYDDFLTYHSPAQAAQITKHHDTYENIDDVIVKNCMEFVPAVLFVRENNPDTTLHNEFKDTNWHFYALGNIGDSKKSDYTRAYDPDDMNEFTCENSDNNTNNGQFLSGVFRYNNEDAIETDYPAWSETGEYESGDIVVYEGSLYECSAETATIGSWVGLEWTAITYTDWTESTPPYFAPRTNPNPMDYIYPIKPSQWNIKMGNTYLNRKHMTLVTEDFDGDHSFEFRYACRGDYRDGDLINDTNGISEVHNTDPKTMASKPYLTNDDILFNLNHDVMLAMYEWLITSDQEQYENEASLWFVKDAMEFFYAFTHYYTMMDNRAKNTFWHFAKTGIYREVPSGRAVPALLHVYEESSDNGTTWTAATGTTIDPNKKYRTQYAFDLWVYDCDTAAGIDNNGALVFPYGKEDGDYRVDGEPSSGYAFNGAGSIFWRRLKTTFANEISEVMSKTGKNCFNSEHLIKEFDDFQNCFPEEIWRLDIERKYIRTYTGASIDNSVQEGKQNARFLMSMMQGRKKYQRRQWIRDLGFYFNSKYNIGDISTNKTEFNIVSPAGDHSLLAVQPDYHLHLTPYQDMYLNVVVGNGTPIPPIRAKANQEYTIKLDDYTAGNFAETRVYISGFKMISKLGNLAPMYPYSFTLNGLDHLKELDIGTENTGYRNGNFTELPLTNEVSLPLLETLNVKNCNSLATSLGLATANNLRVVKAEGSIIGGITLPEYTQIETLHLPSTVTAINLYGARFLKDFLIINNLGQIDYSGLYTLHVYDSDYSANYIWQTETPYAVNDIIMIDNNLYKCKLKHTSVDEYDKDDPGVWAAYLADNWTLIRSNINLPVDWMSIAVDMIEKENAKTSLSLQKLSSAIINDVLVLMPFNSLKAIAEAAGGLVTFSGTITITGSWSKVETKVYTNNVGYYTEENDVQVWNSVLTAMEENDAPIWPELRLVIDPSKEQVKWPVTYRYNDTSKILYINDGTAAPEIYLEDGSGLLTTMPTKASTPQFNYMFGSRDDLQGHYVPYSGWKLSTSSAPLSAAPIIYGPTTLDAYFVGIKRLYYIRWYVEPGKLVRTSRAEDYGGGYTLENPTIKDIHNAGFETCRVSVDNAGMVTYGIFTGWNKLPINIDPDGRNNYFDIYGIWDDNNGQAISISDLFTNVNNLTPAQLLVLSLLTDEQKSTYGINNNIDISTCVTYLLGQDNSTTKYNGHIIQNDTTTPFYLNGSNTQIYTTYQPLLVNQDAFTFAIDYALNETTYTAGKNYAIIASCYHSVDGVRSGFGIFQNINSGAIEVGFGDMYRYANLRVTITNSTNSIMRNIVVLRHPKNSPTLYIYSGLSGDQSIPLEEPYYNYITRNGEVEFNSNAYLNIGTLISNNETIDNTDSIRNSWTRAVGTIYWAKYWEEDLGIGECKRIASWPHEKLTLGITYSYRDPNAEPNSRRAQDDTVPNPTLYLATRNTLMHGLVVQDRKNSSSFINNYYSWENAEVRKLCNNRLLFSLPTSLQAILCKNLTETYPIEYYDGGNEGNGYRIPNYTILTRDYLYAYSAANLLPEHSSYENEDLAMSPFAWRIPANVQVYIYNSSNLSWNISLYNPSSNDGRGAYFNIRFPYVNAFTGTTLRVFKTDSGTGISNIAESIGTDLLRNGDIYIEGSTAYIYVSNSEINTYGLSGILYKDTTRFNGISDSSVINIGGGAGKGGWIRAEDYWTRSLIQNGTQWTIFAETNKDGAVNLDTISSNSTGYKVNYILAI